VSSVPGTTDAEGGSFEPEVMSSPEKSDPPGQLCKFCEVKAEENCSYCKFWKCSTEAEKFDYSPLKIDGFPVFKIGEVTTGKELL
jgi:hypothetical protein